ncbi:hypothetical protein GCM10022206_59160 [Streptomyces chiangmaiensis]
MLVLVHCRSRRSASMGGLELTVRRRLGALAGDREGILGGRMGVVLAARVR